MEITAVSLTEGQHLPSFWSNWIKDVVSGAAVQPAAIQPVELVQPGPDVFTAAGEQQNYTWAGHVSLI